MNLARTSSRVAVAQLGARMHYAVPRILEMAGRLECLFTDAFAGKGWLRALNYVPLQFQPRLLRKFASRKADQIPSSRIVAFNSLGWRYWFYLRQARTATEKAAAHLWAGEEFGRLIRRHGLGSADAIYCFNSSAFALLRFARSEGIRTIYEQAIAPVPVQVSLLQAEQERWPDWEQNKDFAEFYEAFRENEQAEWPLADQIVCGSEFVRTCIAQVGGPAERTVMVPYGTDVVMSGEERIGYKLGPLRVLTVGTVCLRKGAPYVLQCAKQMNGRAEFRWAGLIEVTPAAERALRGRVTLLGNIPRAELAAQFGWADVFLLPSICEGSATATYEALSSGLPVIATANTGSPVRHGEDGFIVPIRNPDAIVKTLERLLADPALLEAMKANARNRRSDLSIVAYGRRLLAALDTG